MDLSTMWKFTASSTTSRALLSVSALTASLQTANVRADASAADSGWQAWAKESCDQVVELRAHEGPFAVAVPADLEFQKQVTFDAQWGDEPVQVVGFHPLLDNERVLYDFALYAREEAPGAGERRLFDWLPSMSGGYALPPDAGIPLPSGPNALTLQLHYWNLDQPSKSDQSGVALCLVRGARLRPNDAGIAILDVPEADVPAGGVLHPASRACTYRSATPVTLISAAPGLHKLGRGLALEIEKADGSAKTTITKDYRFGEREIITFAPGIVLEQGDRIWTGCVYDNVTNKHVSTGWRGSQEVCTMGLTYYPAGDFVCD